MDAVINRKLASAAIRKDIETVNSILVKGRVTYISNETVKLILKHGNINTFYLLATVNRILNSKITIDTTGLEYAEEAAVYLRRLMIRDDTYNVLILHLLQYDHIDLIKYVLINGIFIDIDTTIYIVNTYMHTTIKPIIPYFSDNGELYYYCCTQNMYALGSIFDSVSIEIDLVALAICMDQLDMYTLDITYNGYPTLSFKPKRFTLSTLIRIRNNDHVVRSIADGAETCGMTLQWALKSESIDIIITALSMGASCNPKLSFESWNPHIMQLLKQLEDI